MRIELNKPFGAYGLDSLMSLELVRRLAQTIELGVPVTAVFNYPTVATLASELARRLGSDGTPPQSTDISAVPSDEVIGEIADLTDDEAVIALIAISEAPHG